MPIPGDDLRAGWGVIRLNPWHLAGVFRSSIDAENLAQTLGPAYAVAAGLLRHRLDNPTLDDVEDSYQPTLAHAAMLMRSTASNAWNWLRENF